MRGERADQRDQCDPREEDREPWLVRGGGVVPEGEGVADSRVRLVVGVLAEGDPRPVVIGPGPSRQCAGGEDRDGEAACADGRDRVGEKEIARHLYGEVHGHHALLWL